MSENYRKLRGDFFKPGVDSIYIAVGGPGSGKTTHLTNFINNADTLMSLDESKRPRLLLSAVGGADGFAYDEKVYTHYFNEVEEISNPFEYDFYSKIQNFKSSVILLDDLIILKNSDLLFLLELIFKCLRHKGLTVLIALHTVTHYPGIQALVRYATHITVHSSSPNASSVQRLRQVFGWNRNSEVLLLRELRQMDKRREEDKELDAILFYVPMSLAVLNVITKPLGSSEGHINGVIDLIAGMDEGTEYYLVPSDRLHLVEKEQQSEEIFGEKSKFLSLFSKSSDRAKIDHVLQTLMDAPDVEVDFDNKRVTLTKSRRSCNLLDLCYASVDKRKRRSAAVSSILDTLQKEGLMPEVRKKSETARSRYLIFFTF